MGAEKGKHILPFGDTTQKLYIYISTLTSVSATWLHLAAREAGKWSLKSVWPYAQLSIGKIYYQWSLSCLLIRKYKLFLLGLQCSVCPHPHHSSLGAGLWTPEGGRQHSMWAYIFLRRRFSFIRSSKGFMAPFPKYWELVVWRLLSHLEQVIKSSGFFPPLENSFLFYRDVWRLWVNAKFWVNVVTKHNEGLSAI